MKTPILLLKKLEILITYAIQISQFVEASTTSVPATMLPHDAIYDCGKNNPCKEYNKITFVPKAHYFWKIFLTQYQLL